MTAHLVARNPRPRRRSARPRGWALVAATGLVTLGVSTIAAPAGANGLGWETSWTAPITAAGPNDVAVNPTLLGRAAPPLTGNPARVDYIVIPAAGLPAACAVPGDRATLTGQSFAVAPAFRCNGTYTVSVVARSGGLVPTTSPELRAPLALADPGPAPVGLSSASNSANREVSVAWNPAGDPDVVGYRIRRDGTAVADVGPNVRLYTDTTPGPGAFSYDVQALRWGRGGPGSPSIASPPSAPVTERITAAASGGPAAPGAIPGAGNAPGSSTPGSALPKAPVAAPVLPKTPKPTPVTSGRGSSKSFRSGGTISPSSGGTEVDTFAERLPYRPKNTSRAVEVNEPDQTQTIARTVATPGRERPGLLVPIAAALILVAASMQIRAFLSRTAPVGPSLEGDDSPPRD